jgi:predicted  nucleic acid-binding Zn-ribbon protein
MSPDLERLIRLQHLETTITEAKAKIAAHPQRLADADARLSEARRAVDLAKDQVKANQESRRSLEKDAAVYKARLAKFKDQLFEVKTNREYQAMQHEIATAQSELGAAEEKVLERMLEADALTAGLKKAEAALSASQKEVEAEKNALAGELASLESSLEAARLAREALLREIAPDHLALFEQISRVRKGLAICAATRDGLCSVCHVRLRPHVFQQVRQNDGIHQCESCHRILYYVPPPPPVEHPVVRTS